MSTNGTRLTRTQAWVLALTSAASLMVSLDTQVVATALPVIRLHLHASLAALEWTVNAYTLTFAVLLLTGAALGERLGRRRMLAAGVGLFTAALLALAVLWLSPIAWVVVTSLKPSENIIRLPPEWVPWPATLTHYDLFALLIVIATLSATPARRMLRIADRRRSWNGRT